MSKFPGVFPDLPGVRCDQFQQLVSDSGEVKAQHLFLSHCHSDHMLGLDNIDKVLAASPHTKLYCSMISSSFVLTQFKDKIQPQHVIELMNNVPVDVTVRHETGDYQLRVTAVDAGHCPGSVMFLFQKLRDESQVETRILYTGDFRHDDRSRPLATIRALHDEERNPVKLDKLYLDTTFFTDQYKSFPARRDTELHIWQLVKDWVGRNKKRGSRKKHVVLLHLPDPYGYEKIMMMIYNKSGGDWRVHVDNNKFNTYLCHDILSDSTDCDNTGDAQYVHACHKQSVPANLENCGNYLPCSPGAKNLSVLHIQPSAMFFTSEKLESEGLSVKVEAANKSRDKDCERYRVCFSTHSSYKEIEEFIRYFPADEVIPCVTPPGVDQEEFNRLFSDFVKSLKSPDARSSEGSCDFDSQPLHSSVMKRKADREQESPPPAKVGVGVVGLEHLQVPGNHQYCLLSQ